MTTYEPLFAKYYDYLVHDRREALAADEDIEFVKEAFSSRYNGSVKKVLDIGCGTGRYLVPLAAEGLQLTGIDNSSAMLRQCEERLERRGLKARLVEQDVMKMRDSGEFDAALCMNSVLCYQLETQDILRALALIRDSLRPGGLLILEIWNIFANSVSSGRTFSHHIRDGGLKIVSEESHRYEPFRSILHMTMDVTVSDDDGTEESFIRKEALRAMTAGEVAAYLREAGFAEIEAQSREDLDGDEEFVFFAVRPVLTS